MSIRVVLYAEGPAEHGGEVRMLPPPGHDLDDAHLGAAHILVARIIAEQAGCPVSAVRFVSPLRYRARIARGSELLVPTILKSLLAFPANPRRPELAVVLIDEDGDRTRQSLRGTLEQSILPAALGLAAPEFEAWLIADHTALCNCLGVSIDPPQSPESMAPGDAKSFLNEHLISHLDATAVRRIWR